MQMIVKINIKLFFLIFRSSETFWSTTGLYPQEFVIAFQALMNLNNITVNSFGSEWKAEHIESFVNLELGFIN